MHVLVPVCQPLSARPPGEAAERRSFSVLVELVSSLCEKASVVLTRGERARGQHALGDRTAPLWACVIVCSTCRHTARCEL